MKKYLDPFDPRTPDIEQPHPKQPLVEGLNPKSCDTHGLVGPSCSPRCGIVVRGPSVKTGIDPAHHLLDMQALAASVLGMPPKPADAIHTRAQCKVNGCSLCFESLFREDHESPPPLPEHLALCWRCLQWHVEMFACPNNPPDDTL